MFDTLKRVLIGQPIASSEEHQHRLIKLVALAVFSSDAISSTAYATEEILHVLVPVAAAEALGYLIPISLVVMGLLAVVITSYRQVIFAYPTGGGSYVVAKNNLGETPSLVAGASLLVDYEHFVVVAVGTVNKAVLNAITYARSLAPDRLVAVSVVGDAEEQEAVQKAWAEHSIVIELHTIYSPYRELTEPFMRYLDELDAESDDDIITVVIPEFVTSMGTQWLHNQSALQLKLALLYRPHRVTVSVPIHVDMKARRTEEPAGA